jgi:hypothetical protein
VDDEKTPNKRRFVALEPGSRCFLNAFLRSDLRRHGEIREGHTVDGFVREELLPFAERLTVGQIGCRASARLTDPASNPS